MIGAAQDSFGERFVERVAVRHHEEVRARGRRIDFLFGRIGADDRHVGRDLARKFFGALVDPRDAAWQVAECAHERPADVPGPEQYDCEIDRANGLDVQRPAFEREQLRRAVTR